MPHQQHMLIREKEREI